MNYKLLIFNQTFCEEITIPYISIGKFEFQMDKDYFGLKKDISVKLQVIDGHWCFSESLEYKIRRDKDQFFLRRWNEGDILILETGFDEHLIIVVQSAEKEIDVSRKYLLDKKKNITIGHAIDNYIRIHKNKLVSAHHGVLEHKNDAWHYVNLGTNGSFVNGYAVKDDYVLQYGDIINILGVHLIYLKEIIAILEDRDSVEVDQINLEIATKQSMKWMSMVSVYANDDEMDSEFQPSPRYLAEFDQKEFDIEAPPTPREFKQRSLLLTIGPSFTMVIPMLLGVFLTGTGSMGLGMVTMAGSAVIGAFWAYMNMTSQKKTTKESEEERCRKYREYLQKKEKELKEQYIFNKKEMEKMYPSTDECVHFNSKSAGLWNRNRNQNDYLNIRLGTGKVPLQKMIRIPEERFTLIDDELAKEPARIKETYEKITDAPVCINLEKTSLYGVIGGKNQDGIWDILKTICVQIGANFSYADVKVVLICDKKHREEQKFVEHVKWLPHLWNDEHTFRYAADTKEGAVEVLNELLSEFRYRKEQQQDMKNQKNRMGSHYVVIVTAADFVKEHPVFTYLKDSNLEIGVTTFLCAEQFEQLPNTCEWMIQNTNLFKGCYTIKQTKDHWMKVCFDSVSDMALNNFSHRMASIKIRTSEKQQEIPTILSFLDMYGVNTVEELNIEKRWSHSRSYESLRVPVGMRSGKMLSYLDVHERVHGPHGLVAGTTGSGKSEMLQTWILSLAVNFSPEEVMFLLIDFKGGGMANQFVKLPHLAGCITNLNENQVQRALVTIRSENIRRQKCFIEAGVKDINDYTRLYKNREISEPIPHLLIVVDEFAELKKECPEFMSELVSVAAIGRSLGVHLILATQKPAGVVDDKIDSNSRFRICLKVQDKQDSNDMLKRPDAAYITQTGRGYLRVGTDEVFEQFQSAWSGATYSMSDFGNSDELAKLYTISGRSEIIGTHQKLVRKEKEKRNWITKLSETVLNICQIEKISIKHYITNEHDRQILNEKFYQYFTDYEWNILPSAYNDARLMDLMFVLDMCGVKEPEDIAADAILTMAKTMGRSFPEVGKKTQLSAVIDTISDIADKTNLVPKNKLWLPELPRKLYLSELNDGNGLDSDEWSLDVCIGKYDDPEHQYQGKTVLDLANGGSYGIYGSIGTGKSTFLQTVAYALITKYSPEQLNMYCIDYSSRMLECFMEAPQVGGVLTEQDSDKLGKFFYMMKQILSERKGQLKGGSFVQYMRSGGKNMPAIVLMIDQIGSFREKTDNAYDNVLMELAKEGQSNGIYLILSAAGYGHSEIPSKMAENIPESFCLKLTDKYQYRELLNGAKISMYPEEGVRGRGLMQQYGNVYEYQTALAIEAENEFQRAEKIEQMCQFIAEHWEGVVARPIPVIPENPTYSQFVEHPDVRKMLSDDRYLPLGYSVRSAGIWGLDLSKFYCYLAAGRKRTGKTNFLQMVARMAALKGGKVHIFGKTSEILSKTAEEIGANYWDMDGDLVPFCLEIKPELMRRNQKKNRLEKDGYSDEEIYQVMCHEKSIYLIVDDLAALTERLYQIKAGETAVNGFFETFADKGWYHQIFIFAGMDPEKRSSVYGKTFYDFVTRDKNGISFGGNVYSQQLLDFSYLSMKEQSMVQPKGVGLLAVGEGRMAVGKVMIPNARK